MQVQVGRWGGEVQMRSGQRIRGREFGHKVGAEDARRHREDWIDGDMFGGITFLVVLLLFVDESHLVLSRADINMIGAQRLAANLCTHSPCNESRSPPTVQQAHP